MAEATAGEPKKPGWRRILAALRNLSCCFYDPLEGVGHASPFRMAAAMISATG